MGPRGESLSNQPKRPTNVDNSEDDEDDQNDGWRIGFDVEMRGIGIERTSSNTTDDESSNELEQQNDYQQIPSSSNNDNNSNWIPSTPKYDLPEAPPLEHLKIEHQPIDISMDKDKIDQIKSIMSQINGSLNENIPQQPEWLKNVDDNRLGEIIRDLAKK
uniref:Uncharacterized protein n=1 Tax=Meloidogyne hapla TaxID=6305 RepID=A0A1I8BBI3_MELHA